MYFAPPIDYDKVMKRSSIRQSDHHRKNPGIFCQTKRRGFYRAYHSRIFVSIAAWASYQRSGDETPYWRTLRRMEN